MTKRSLILITIIVLLTAVSQAYEFNIAVNKRSNDAVFSDSSNYGVSASSSGPKERVESNMVDPVTIKNYIIPSKIQGYVSGDKARLFLEIKNNKKNPIFSNISAIGIRELVDDDLGILPETAKWKIEDSIDEISDMKLDLFRENIDLSQNLKKYNDCDSITKYYKLINISSLTNLNSDQKIKIIDILHDYFDVIWINKADVSFKNTSEGLFINNSKNNWVNISIKSSNSAQIFLSDGRIYDLKIEEFDGFVCV